MARASKHDPLADVDRHRTIWQQGEVDGDVRPAPDAKHTISVTGIQFEGEGSFVSADDRPVRYINAAMYLTAELTRRLLAQFSPTGVDALWTKLQRGEPVRTLANEYRLEKPKGKRAATA